MSNYNLSLQSRLPWGIQLRKNHGEKLWIPVERTKRFGTNDTFIFINFISFDRCMGWFFSWGFISVAELQGNFTSQYNTGYWLWRFWCKLLQINTVSALIAKPSQSKHIVYVLDFIWKIEFIQFHTLEVFANLRADEKAGFLGGTSARFLINIAIP